MNTTLVCKDPYGHWGNKDAFYLTQIEIEEGPDLFEIVRAGGFLRGTARLVQRGQQHGRQDGDDCDYDQQFNQSE